MSSETNFTDQSSVMKGTGKIAAAILITCTALLICTTLVSSNLRADLPTSPISDIKVPYANTPVTSSGIVPPLVMLALSRDEQLSVKAYTDYTDLDGDGIIDTTYNNNFAYGGYFDPDLCYTYGSINYPVQLYGVTISGYKASGQATNHQCSGSWGGNFLNWLTMSRLDIVRYSLYGGKRAVDVAATSTTAAQTVLQRSFIPDDIHSWAKVYRASDISKYTPYSTYPMSFCNTSSLNSYYAYSATGDVPIMRVAQGDFPTWAATESRQCDWRDQAASASGDQPYSTTANSSQIDVYVDVCDNAATLEAFCRKYTNGTVTSYKPAGLLQQYGEAAQMRFGLITGSYDHSRSGGVLRRNISTIASNDTSATSTGCGAGDEINYKTGVFCPQIAGAQGIINTVNRLQVAHWPNAPYSGAGGSYDDCTNGTAVRRSGTNANALVNPGPGNYTCQDWGNPLAEIFAEALRYVDGDSMTASFQSPTTGSIDATLGLPTAVTWVNPYSASNACAACNIIVLSTGNGSFDSDEIPNVTNLGDTASAATTRLGAIENSIGDKIVGSDIIGYYGATPIQTGTTDPTAGTTDATGNSQPRTSVTFCAARGVTDLALVRGICPSQPTTEGSFQIAGLAFDAWTRDLRPDLTGVQRVKTFAVPLAEALPSFAAKTSAGTITLSALCQNVSSGGTPCRVNDANVSLQIATATVAPYQGVTYGLPYASDGSRGSLALVWEDQIWGSDSDRDLNVLLTFCVGAACNYDGNNDGKWDICEDFLHPVSTGVPSSVCPGGTFSPPVGGSQILVRSEIISASTGAAMQVGYTVNGSTVDGQQLVNSRSTGYGGDVYNTLTGTIANSGERSVAPYTPSVKLFTGGNTSANTLKNPLFYAAKYGGFSYQSTDINPQPTTIAQWDSQVNSTGAVGTDGLPDNYFPVSNPSQLKTQLGKVLASILARAGSGTAAAVVGTDRQGLGVVYQALFENQHKDAVDSTQSATWIGNLQALFIDSQGRLREDGNGDGTLQESSLSIDPAVTITYDKGTSTTVVYRDTGGGPVQATLDTLKPLWNARQALSSLTSVEQRTYTANASTGRYIFTFLDYNQNGIPASNEVVPFVAGNSGFPVTAGTSSNWGMLNVDNINAVSDLISYIRGSDTTISGNPTRNRTIRYSLSDTTAQVMRLGDIVNSSPAAVSAPSESFDLLYNDATYGAFYSQYRNRRSVVYVGANDGMIHAFNGGFYDPSGKKFGLSNNGGSEVQHPLGAELWAYIPYNLLPHLTWLTDPNYPHAWYVDGSPRIFDARIFPNDTKHPGGWGTVLMTGFRFGGGPVTLTAPNNNALGLFGLKKGGTLSTRSAYVLMDVTDPESAPSLIAEISGSSATDSRLGYTTGYPTVAAFKGAASGDVEKWYLIFGSGPNNYEPATSTNNAGLYVYDLGTNGTVQGFVTGYTPFDLPGATASFAGDPVSVDWNLDYKAEALYVGTIGTTITSGQISAETGQLYKLNFNNISTSSAWTKPTSSIVNPNDPVIGTPSVTQDEFGRHWVFAGTGRFFAQADKSTTIRQSLFGFIDTLDSKATPTPAAPDYTKFIDVTNAVVTTDGNVTGVTGSTTQTALVSNVATAGGWVLKLGGGGTTIAERNFTPTSLLGDTLFATGFTPSGTACAGDGSSELFGLYYKTGTARSDIPAFGTALDSNGNKTTTVLRTLDLGAGVGAAPSLRVNGVGASAPLTIYTQSSSGAINVNAATVTNKVRSGEVDWRESHPTYKQ